MSSNPGREGTCVYPARGCEAQPRVARRLSGNPGYRSKRCANPARVLQRGWVQRPICAILSGLAPILNIPGVVRLKHPTTPGCAAKCFQHCVAIQAVSGYKWRSCQFTAVPAVRRTPDEPLRHVPNRLCPFIAGCQFRAKYCMRRRAAGCRPLAR